jgi:autotransporter-associated beta strand protein
MRLLGVRICMHRIFQNFLQVAVLGTSLACLSAAQAGTLSVTNGSFTNLTSNSVTGGGWYGGVPAGWTSAAPSSSYSVLDVGGTYYANVQALGPGGSPFITFRQNVGTVDITSDITLTFTQTTLGPYTSGLGSGIYDPASSPLGSYNSGPITSASTVSYTARGVGPGNSLYIAFWNTFNASGISGVSIADFATTYEWNGGVSGVWANGGSGWTDKFDNTATTYNNAKPVVAQFTNGSAGTNVNVGGNVVVGNIQVSGANYNFSGGTITITNTTWSVGEGQTASVGSTLAGTTGLTKADLGTLALSASNNYSGGTTLIAGTLALQNANALGSGNLTVNGGTFDLGGNNLTAANLGGNGGTIALGANTLTTSMTTGRSFAGTISGTGNLVKNGSSFLTLSGNNSYEGGTTISDGTLFVTGVGTLGNESGAITISNTTSTATLDLRNEQTRTGTITMIGQGARLASGDVNNPGSLINKGNALEFGGGLITVSVSGTGGLNVTGGGTIDSSNSYTGATMISGTAGWYGTDQLFVNNTNALGDASGELTISGGNVNLTTKTITRSGNVTISGGTLNNGTLSKSGGNFDLQAGAVYASLAGTAGLIKSTTKEAALNGANSYTGGTMISNGTLYVGSSGTLGDAGGDVTVSGTGSDSTFVVLDLRNLQTRTGGTITMTGQDARIITGGGGSIVNNGGDFCFDGGSLELSVSGTGGMNVTGGGQIISANSYTGDTTISGTTGWYGSNTFFVSNDTALGAATGGLTISGGIVSLMDRTITRSGNVTITGGNVHTGTISKSGGDYDIRAGQIDAVLAGTSGLTKNGLNAAVLTGANTYSGTTSVTAGTLVIKKYNLTDPILTATISPNSLSVDFPSTPTAGTTYNILSGTLASASLGSTTVTVAGGSLPAGLTATVINSPNLKVVVQSTSSQTPQETYLASFGLSGDDLLGTADPDGDGMDNNAEFAFGTSPISGASRATTLTSGTGEIILTYLQRKTGVTYAVKSLPNLTTPFNSGTPVTPSLSNNQGNLPSDDYERYEAKLRTDSSRGFLQVKAVVP